MPLPIDITPLKTAAIDMMASVEILENGFDFPDFDPAISLTVPQHKAWLTGLKAEKTLQNARIQYLGDHFFKIDMPSIACTGADVITRFNIPYSFQLERIEMKHTDASDVDNTDALTYSLDKKMWNNLLFNYITETTSPSSDIIKELEDYFFEKGELVLTTNTTNNHKLFQTIFIKMMEI
jgi:hypothetical protein